MSDVMTIFEEKALDDLALALLDWGTDKQSLPGRMEETARLVGCTPAELAVYLHGELCSLMTMPRLFDCFGLPMLDIEAARASLLEGRRIGRSTRLLF